MPEKPASIHNGATAKLRGLKIGESIVLPFKHRSAALTLAAQAEIAIQTEQLTADSNGYQIKCTRIRRKK